MKMKTGLYSICFVLTLIIAIASQIEAYLYCHPNIPVVDKCRKSNEIPRRPILYRVCGDHLFQAYKQVCFSVIFKRTADDVLLERQSANRFLSLHHRSKRSFNAVEECCHEGCVPEELYEYCKPY